jgi:hypothetical protein
MIWMVFSELMPDALDEASANLVAIIITLSVLAMVAFQVLIRKRNALPESLRASREVDAPLALTCQRS